MTLLDTMRMERRAGIRNLMLKAQDPKVDVREILRAIKNFDREAMLILEGVARWQQVLVHFEETPFTPFVPIEKREQE